MERRYLPIEECPVSIERRDGEEPKIVGRAAVFYDGTEETEYVLFPEITGEDGAIVVPRLVERIHKFAFNRALKEKQDVRALFNHDPNLILGRTTSKTLVLEKSLRGLDYTITPGNTTVARDTVEHLERKDVTGSSFGFVVTDQKFTHDKERGIDVREIRDVDLFDVSPVTFPAYESTSAGIRDQMPSEMRAIGSLDEARKARDTWRASGGHEQDDGLEERLAAILKRAEEVGAESERDD